MATEAEHDPRLEIAHVLFIDIVGYSKLPINEQTALVKRLNHLVRSTAEFRAAEAAGKLIRIATGDGMALAFFTSPDAPVRCAVELSRADQADPKIALRMGIHSGPVDQLADVNERSNLAGAGMNMAQRVMDCGDAGHILLSKRLADDLSQYSRWNPHLHDLGQVEVKHGVKIDIVNFYGDGVGNGAVPGRIAAATHMLRQRSRKKTTTIALLLVGIAIGLSIFAYRPTRLRTAPELVSDKGIAVLPFEKFKR